METLIQWIAAHASYAHWIIFGAIILAGMNIPISADVLIIISAVLAATVVPENIIPLYLSIFFGCLISAWVAYGVGRLLGARLWKFRWFSKLLPANRVEKIQRFYGRYGFLTLLVGRFIPFGVRNCIFMTSGASRVHFGKFALYDSIACLVWSSISFYVFYTLGHNYQALSHYLKTFNLLIFSAFSVTVIVLLWYKRRKRARSTTT